MSSATSELLTPAEVADILRVKPDFVRDLVRRGVLEGYAIGGPQKRRIVVPRTSVDSYLEQCKVSPPLKIERPAPKIRAEKIHGGLPLLKKYARKA